MASEEVTAALNEVLTYWFGATSPPPAEEKEKWRGGLWFRSLDPKVAKQYPEEDGAAIATRTDAYIAQRFGPLLDLFGGNGKQKQPEEEEKKCSAEEILEDQVAKVILWDQLARNAFRGTPRAFAYDEWAQPLAFRLLENPENKEYFITNWNHAVFLCMALMHAEDVEYVKLGLHNLEDVQKKLQAKDQAVVASRLKPILKNFLSHLDVVLRFGRYPSRNTALRRTSTPEELQYLTSEKLPRWAKSQRPLQASNTDGPKEEKAKLKQEKKNPLRMLVLHGNRANLRKFKLRVRDTLKGISSPERPVQLDFIKAPNFYQSQDTQENKYLEGVGVGVGTDQHAVADNRCWWYMDGNTGHYVGLDKSIQALEDWMEDSGPYDGVVGFAQGGCMAAILASLQHEGRLRIRSNLRFVIAISGFYCRDSREEYANLHASLSAGESIHAPDTVQLRTDKIAIPSFHTWGLKDSLVDGWRSETLSKAFQDPTVEPHPGEHIARGVEHWPIASIRQWLASLQMEARHTEIIPTTPLDNFADKFFALKRATSSKRNANKDTATRIQHPVRLHNQERIMTDPFWSMTPNIVTEVSFEMLAEFVPRLFQLVANGQLEDDKDWKHLVDDAMIVGWCFYPIFLGRKRRNCRGWNDAGKAFCWMFRLLFEWGSDECREYMLDFHLPWIARHSDTWESLVRIDMVFMLGRSEKGVDPPPKHQLDPSTYAALVRSGVAKVFADQLADDFRIVVSAKEAYGEFCNGQETGESDESVKMQLYRASSLPSKCVESVPRVGSATCKLTRLDEAVAEALTECSKEALDIFPRGSAKNRYKNVVKEVAGFLREYEAALADSQNSQDHAIRDSLRMSDQQWKAAFERPLSAAILNPMPEIVDIATAEQMAPLHKFLRERPTALAQTVVTFERGTLLDDGRLDLCKQVIGPQGINPLFESLAYDEHGLVQHLLLGNNVAGDDLGNAVGDFIQSGQSKLTTWYIAGNRLTVDGVRPVCEALSKDEHVRQLWLKRNPLLPVGMGPIASLLRGNSHLQVLDLTNTGITDEGCCTVMEALVVNPALEYLYLDTNGITVKGVVAIRQYFETTTHSSLKGLSLGCNRVGDKGTKELVQGLKKYGVLKKLTLASCGIGLEGARWLADFLTSEEGSELRFLDLGYLKSTFAVGEVTNRILTEGAETLAEALKSNSTLEGLVLSNNNIYNKGFTAFEEALRANHENSALRHFVLHQPGIPVNEIVLEKIRFYVKAKALAWQKQKDTTSEDDFVDPSHLDEIQSVYRVGAKYDTE